MKAPSPKIFPDELRFERLREILSRFEPCPGKKKDQRLDWSRMICQACGFNFPMWHQDTHVDAKMSCPLCGAYRQLTVTFPNQPDLAKWWDDLSGGADAVRRKAEEKAREEKRKRAKGQQTEQYFED